MDNIFLLIDALCILIVYYLLRKKVEFLEIKNIWAMAIPMLIIMVLSTHFKLYTLGLFMAFLLIVVPLMVVTAYPQRFRNFLEDYKGRKVNVKNIEKLLDKESEEQLIDAITQLSRKRFGSSILIAREDDLKDIEETGDSVGEIAITSDVIQLLAQPNSFASKGAIVIRDNKIVAVNCKMPMLKSEQIARAGGNKRHFGMLGTVNKYDSVVIGTSQTSGGITLGGTTVDNRISFNLMVQLKDFDLQNGVTKEVLSERLHVLLVGKGNTDDLVEVQRQKDEEPSEPKKKRKAKKPKENLTREQKKALREDRRNGRD